MKFKNRFLVSSFAVLISVGFFVNGNCVEAVKTGNIVIQNQNEENLEKHVKKRKRKNLKKIKRSENLDEEKKLKKKKQSLKKKKYLKNKKKLKKARRSNGETGSEYDSDVTFLVDSLKQFGEKLTMFGEKITTIDSKLKVLENAYLKK